MAPPMRSRWCWWRKALPPARAASTFRPDPPLRSARQLPRSPKHRALPSATRNQPARETRGGHRTRGGLGPELPAALRHRPPPVPRLQTGPTHPASDPAALQRHQIAIPSEVSTMRTPHVKVGQSECSAPGGCRGPLPNAPSELQLLNRAGHDARPHHHALSTGHPGTTPRRPSAPQCFPSPGAPKTQSP
jgi:hypothetical protein